MPTTPTEAAPAQVAGWLHGGGPQWGRVLDRTDERFTVADGSGTRRLQPADVAVVVDGGDPREVAAAARSRAGSLDPEELWQRLGPGGREPRHVGELAAAAGMDAPADRAAFWLLMWEAPEYFARAGRARFRVRDAAEVEAERERLRRKRREEKLLGELAAEARRIDAGELTLDLWQADRIEVRAVLEELAHGREPDVELSEGVRQQIVHYLEHQYEERGTAWPLSWFAAEALGDPDPWRSGHPRLAVHRRWLQGWREPDVARPAVDLPDLTPATDLWAVDDADTVERDDAVGLRPDGSGRAIVEVAVADVTAGYAADPALLDRAGVTATSVYLPTGAIPMLPPALGYGSHSLDPGVTRPAFLLRAPVDLATGELLDRPTLLRGRLAIHGAVAYADIDRGHGVPAHWPELADVAAARAEARYAAGADRIESPEAVVVVRGGHPVDLLPVRPWVGARAVIRELMILANEQFATMLADAGLPAPYRVQHGESRQRTPVKVGLRPGPHVGLGAAAYVYGTSPIRRLADALAQRQLLGLLGKAPMDHDELRDRVAAAEQRYQDLRRWMASAGRYWKLRYLEAAPETPLVGVPVDEPDEPADTIKIRVDPVALTERLPAPPAPPGASHPLRLVAVDAELGHLSLDWR